MIGYNFKKETCDVCGISKEKRKNMPPMQTGINHPEYCLTTSFKLGFDGSVLCPECSKEKQLKELFDLMDRREIHGN